MLQNKQIVTLFFRFILTIFLSFMFSSSFFFFALSSKICLIRNVELSDDVTPNGLKEAASSAYGKKDFEAVLLQLLGGP